MIPIPRGSITPETRDRTLRRIIIELSRQYGDFDFESDALELIIESAEALVKLVLTDENSRLAGNEEPITFDDNDPIHMEQLRTLLLDLFRGL